MDNRFTRKFFLLFVIGFLSFLTKDLKSQNCDTPTNVITSNVSNFSNISSNLDTAVHHYRIRYRESGTSVWSYNHNVPQALLIV